MGTEIQWTDETWNPVTGCRKVSPGCKNCYAEGVAERFWPTQYPPVVETSVGPFPTATRPRRFTDVQVHEDRLEQPLRWRKPRRVFVNSMSDLFHEDVSDDFIARVFGVMAAAERHTFQVLTKRPERMRDLLSEKGFLVHLDDAREWLRPGSGDFTFPLPNVWLGVSVEDQARADERIPLLLDTPAAVRFLSCEPLLGPVDVYHGAGGSGDERLDWIIVGGESGARARPMDLAWARALLEQGRAAGVPVFVKQLGRRPVFDFDGETFDLDLRDGHGGAPDEWPDDLRVREFPA